MNIIQGNVLVQVINMLINDHTCYSQQVGLIKKTNSQDFIPRVAKFS